jgi:hypothetical protein
MADFIGISAESSASGREELINLRYVVRAEFDRTQPSIVIHIAGVDVPVTVTGKEAEYLYDTITRWSGQSCNY